MAVRGSCSDFRIIRFVHPDDFRLSSQSGSNLAREKRVAARQIVRNQRQFVGETIRRFDPILRYDSRETFDRFRCHSRFSPGRRAAEELIFAEINSPLKIRGIIAQPFVLEPGI